MASKNNFAYYGSSAMSASLLAKLITNGLLPQMVITIKAKPAGRGLNIPLNPLLKLANEYSLPVMEIMNLKDGATVNNLKTLASDYAILLAFGKIIPQDVLDIYPSGIINIHPSLLPRYRGPSPIQSAILNDDAQTGVTLIKLDIELDHGPIIAQQPIKIKNGDWYQDIEKKVIDVAAKLILANIDGYLENKLTLQEQNHQAATFTKKITKDHGQINWHDRAVNIYNALRAYSVWPGLWTTFKGKRLKILALSVTNEPTIGSGRVTNTNNRLIIGCLDYNIIIHSLQLEGKNALTAIEFIRGHQDLNTSQLPS